MSEPASPPYQCSTCNSDSVKSKNLVVFIDGTSNKPGPKETNVVKLARQLLKCRVDGLHSEQSESKQSESEKSGLEQRGCYFSGLGTSKGFVCEKISNALEMGLAWNVGKNVKNAYTWLVDKYSKGDRIYLFGFSRGAYQVRALAGIIHEVGLVDKNKNKVPNPIDYAYELYESIYRKDPRTKEQPNVFKREYCWPDVRIHFVGVWDTVSSLGLVKREVHITESASVTNACHFRHALALDERRVKFMPEYFKELNVHHGNVKSPRKPVSDVEETWFAGSHSDVGGISRLHADGTPNNCHSGNVPFLWMRREATVHGLVLNPETFDWSPKDIDDGRKDTMTFPWSVFEVIPIFHQVSFSGTGRHARRRHRFHPRTVIPKHRIHPSVLSGDLYTLRASLGDGHEIPTEPREALGELYKPEVPGGSSGDTANEAINQLRDQLGRFPFVSKDKTPRQLVSLLKLVASGTSHLSDAELANVTMLAEEERRPVGPAAVGALVALQAPLTSNIPILNILGYFGDTLPRLDVEVGSTSRDNNVDLESPRIFGIQGGEQLMDTLVSTIVSRKARERTAAMLTVLKLCRNLEIRNRYLGRLVHVFIAQLKRKRTSLLAAYALKTSLDLGMQPDREDTDGAAQAIVAMLDNGWFDDAVGRIEGFDVFRGLMAHEQLRRTVLTDTRINKMMMNLEGGKLHDVRMNSICLEILWKYDPANLTTYVKECISKLSVKSKRTWTKAVKALSALAQMKAGEEEIKEHMLDIVKILLPSQDRPLEPNSRMRGPASALYGLCKNETLRELIKKTDEYQKFRKLYMESAEQQLD